MNNKQKQIHTIDTVFPLIFILLFGFCALALVLSGAHVYQDTTDGLKQNYTIRTAATYLQEKVREYSSESQVEVLSQDGQTVLALYEEGDSGYVTYIYLYKGKLWELFTKKGRDIVWSSGQELVSVDTFSVTEQKEDLLQIELSGDGQEELLYIRIYGEDGKCNE